MIIYTTRLVPEGFAALTVWPFIFILPAFRGDEALKQHELVHYREQAWVTPLWFLRYAFSRDFRVKAEVRAYKIQIKLGGLSLKSAAKWLMKYDSSLTEEQALSLLTN